MLREQPPTNRLISVVFAARTPGAIPHFAGNPVAHRTAPAGPDPSRLDLPFLVHALIDAISLDLDLPLRGDPRNIRPHAPPLVFPLGLLSSRHAYDATSPFKRLASAPFRRVR
ncbi:hypothetical protein JCM10213_007925 [Rhodosporidiobolus nylandii]